MRGRLLRCVSGAGALALGLLAHPTATPAAAEPGTVASTVPVGIRFELAARAVAAGDTGPARALLDALGSGDDVAGLDDGAALMLRGSLDDLLGDPAGAASRYRQAAGRTGDADRREAAAYLAAQALESAGDDDGALRAWQRWAQEHPGGRLAPEARLRLAWLHLRGGRTEAAATSLAQLAATDPWLREDRDWRRVQAAVDYLQGRPDVALAQLGEAPDGALPLYLKGLCEAAGGEALAAAASFQAVAARHPRSPLRDAALFAKANTFLGVGAWRSAAEDFAAVADCAADPDLAAEAALRHAVALYLDGDLAPAIAQLRELAGARAGTGVAARAQFLLGDALAATGQHAGAIVAFNEVLGSHFDRDVAADAQYRIARSYAALGRVDDATTACLAVVTGFPLSPQAPAASYLAGCGLLEAGRPREAAEHFQLVLDRYARREDGDGTIVFSEPAHRELVDAALCMQQVAWQRTGDQGRLSGAAHALLHRLPPSCSPWRAWALLIDADAQAGQGLYADARASLERLQGEFPDHTALPAAGQLLAWTWAQEGDQERAVAASQDVLARDTGGGDRELFNQALLNIAHVRFNQGRHDEALPAYEEFLRRNPEHPDRQLVLFQSGLCHLRLERAGDAVDRWEQAIAVDATSQLAEQVWARAGDLYFQAERYEDARRCYSGLLEHFATGEGAALGRLRLAQCDFNAGRDQEAIAGFGKLLEFHPASPLRPDAEQGIEQALYRLGQADDGVSQLAELVEHHPDSPFAADAQFRIASRLYENRQFEEAADAFRRVVSGWPGYSAADRAQYLMAESYAEAGRGESARQAWEQFLGFFGKSDLKTPARFRLGLNRFEAADYGAAARSFEEVVAAAPGGDTEKAALYNLALSRRLDGQPAPAALRLQEYRERYPADERAAAVAFQLGDLHEQAGRLVQAAAELDAAAKAAPQEPLRTEVYFRLGACREKLGDKAGALAAYRQAAACPVATDPFRLSALARGAVLSEDEGDLKAALSAYRDLMRNASDPQLVAAATDRADQIAAGAR
ncbi:MAG: tetratricopeptide repeat protein [bacterium]|nr:tetratricopeptide repeat protein [bacterium]